MVGSKVVILERRTKNPSKTLLLTTQNLFLSLYSSFLPHQTLGISSDLVYPKSLLTGLVVNKPESMIIVWVIFSTSSADPFWEGSSASIRPMFFKLGVRNNSEPAAFTTAVANPIAKQIASISQC